MKNTDRKISKSEIIKILDQANKYLKQEEKLWKLTKNILRENREHYHYDDFYSLRDMVCFIFTNMYWSKRESHFCSPNYPLKGKVVSWIDNDPDSVVKRYWGYGGHIGDIITDVLFDHAIHAERKYVMLKKFFTKQDSLIEDVVEKKKLAEKEKKKSKTKFQKGFIKLPYKSRRGMTQNIIDSFEKDE